MVRKKSDLISLIHSQSTWMHTIIVVVMFSFFLQPEKSIVNTFDTVQIHKDPFGVVLVIGAWNYPLQLTLAPVAG